MTEPGDRDEHEEHEEHAGLLGAAQLGGQEEAAVHCHLSRNVII